MTNHPSLVMVVALQNRIQYRYAGVMIPRNNLQELNVASQCAAAEGRASPDIGFLADARIKPQRGLDFAHVGGNALANACDLVGKSYAGGEIGIERVLHHLGGFDARPQQRVAEWLEHRFNYLACIVAANPNDDPLRLGENPDGIPEPEIFRRIGEGNLATFCDCCEILLQQHRATDRHLRGNQDDGAVLQIRKRKPDAIKNVTDVSDIIIIDRGVEADPDEVSRRDRPRYVLRESERTTFQTLFDQSVKAGLKQRRLPGVQFSCSLQRLRKTNGRNPLRGEARSRHRAKMPQTVDADLHDRASRT